MGSTAERPKYTPYRDPYESKLRDLSYERYLEGLTDEEEAMLRTYGTDTLGAGARESRQRIDEEVSSLGTTPGTLGFGAKRQIESDLGKNLVNLERTIADADRQAKDVGFNQYAAINELGMRAESMNDYDRWKTYEYDLADDFNWGQAAGQAAGIAGEKIPVTCFCFAEVFGKDSIEFREAAKWAIENVTDETTIGYVIFSSWIIPLMRRFPKFKAWFKENVAVRCLKAMLLPASVLDRITLSFFINLCELIGTFCDPSAKQVKIVNSVFK